MLQELCRLIEFFYESGLLVAAAAGPSGCRGACPCGRWQAMSPPARDAAAGWRWLAGWGGLPHVFESFTNKSRKAGARGWFRPMAMAPHGSVAGPVAPPSGPFGPAASWFLTAETASAGCRYGPSWLAERAVSRRCGVALAGCFGCARRETAVSQRVGSLARIWPSWLVRPPAGVNTALSGQIILALIRHAKSRCVAVGMLF